MAHKINWSFVKMYSTPFNVLTTIETSDKIAWRNGAFWYDSSSSRNWFLLGDFIRKMSFLIISYTRFLRSSGAIWSALTLKDKSTSIIPRESPVFLAYISFTLCSCMTLSLKSSERSHRPSVLSIWLYFES